MIALLSSESKIQVISLAYNEVTDEAAIQMWEYQNKLSLQDK